MQVGRELARRLQVVPERLLDDHPLPVRHQASALAEAARPRWRTATAESRGRTRVRGGRRAPCATFEYSSLAVEVAADVAELGREPVEHLVVEVLAGLLDRVAGAAAKIVVGQVLARHPEHGHVEQPAPLEPVERAERLLPGQVAGYPEDDQGVGFAFAHRFDLLRFDLPRVAELLRQRHVLGARDRRDRDRSRARTAASRTGARTGTPRNRFSPSSPSPMIACRSRLDPSATAESLTCSDPRRSSPTTRSNCVDHLAEGLRRADVVARREQVARVEADPEPLAAAGGVEQRRELLERAPERAAGAGRVLEVQRGSRRSRPAPP